MRSSSPSGHFLDRFALPLDYSSERYAATREGAIVSCELFGIVEGSSVSREFAALLGISDAWDFNQHRICGARVNLEGLREFCRLYADYQDDFTKFELLLRAELDFHFRPEG